MLLMCVQSVAFQKVSGEMGGRSLELAREFSLTTAELSNLQDGL
jgi:hypothetical protein